MSGLLVVGGIVVALIVGRVFDRRRQRFYDEYLARRRNEEVEKRRQ